MRPLRPARGRGRGESASADRESGSATFIMIMWALVLWLLLAVVVDVGLAISQRERAADLADQAARAEAQNFQVTDLRKGTTALVDDPQCSLAQAYLGSAQVVASVHFGSASLDRSYGTNGCQFIGTDTVTVAVNVTYKPLIFDIFGVGTITVTQMGTAVAAAGTN